MVLLLLVQTSNFFSHRAFFNILTLSWLCRFSIARMKIFPRHVDADDRKERNFQMAVVVPMSFLSASPKCQEGLILSWLTLSSDSKQVVYVI